MIQFYFLAVISLLAPGWLQEDSSQRCIEWPLNSSIWDRIFLQREYKYSLGCAYYLILSLCSKLNLSMCNCVFVKFKLASCHELQLWGRQIEGFIRESTIQTSLLPSRVHAFGRVLPSVNTDLPHGPVLRVKRGASKRDILKNVYVVVVVFFFFLFGVIAIGERVKWWLKKSHSEWSENRLPESRSAWGEGLCGSVVGGLWGGEESGSGDGLPAPLWPIHSPGDLLTLFLCQFLQTSDYV